MIGHNTCRRRWRSLLILPLLQLQLQRRRRRRRRQWWRGRSAFGARPIPLHGARVDVVEVGSTTRWVGGCLPPVSQCFHGAAPVDTHGYGAAAAAAASFRRAPLLELAHQRAHLAHERCLGAAPGQRARAGLGLRVALGLGVAQRGCDLEGFARLRHERAALAAAVAGRAAPYYLLLASECVLTCDKSLKTLW